MKYIKPGDAPTATPETAPPADALLLAALELAGQGVKVFPCHRVTDGACTCMEDGCKSPGKHPRTKNGSKDATTDEDQIREWWAKWGKAGRLNYGQTLAGRAVVDIDTVDGKPGMGTWIALMEEHHGNAEGTLAYQTGRGGTQFVFTLPEGESGGRGDGYGNSLGEAVDFKTGPNAYVMVPGSKTVDVYTVVVAVEAAPLPAWIAELAKAEKTVTAGAGGDGKTITISGGGSVLSDLLALPVDDPRRGNDWLAKVAGHYAKMFRDKKDLFQVHCRLMNAMSDDPIGEADFTKTTESIWATEMAKTMSAGPKSGFLQSAGDHIEVMTTDDKGTVGPPEPWADFDIKVMGIVDEEDSERRFFDCRVTIERSGEVKERLIEAAKIADGRKLTEWLASMGCTIGEPKKAMGGYRESTRLIRYLESQNAPLSRAVNELGWHRELETFVTHHGVIRPGAAEFEPFTGVRPSPGLKLPGVAPYRYGFAPGGREELRGALGEILTFHDAVPLSALAAWYSMVVLMPEVRTRVSVFPFFAVEAVSGSGKTTGSIAMIQQMFGYDAPPGTLSQPQAAKLLSKTRSGAVWMDDADDPGKIHEVLRMLTGGGSRVKSGGQNWDQTVVDTAHGGFIVTGEGLGFNVEKALLDRMLRVDLTDPSGRKSLKPGREGMDQWDDVVAMKNRYGGSLTALAGTMVAELLKIVPDVPDLVTESKPKGAGRKSDVYGVLLAGARVVDWLLDPEADWDRARAGEGRTAVLLREWMQEQLASGSKAWDNTLTLDMLPWAIRQFGEGWSPEEDYKNTSLKQFPAKVRDPQEDEPRATYGFGEDVVYFHGPSLVDAWAAYKKDPKLRVSTSDAIRQQARAAGFEEKKIKMHTGAGNGPAKACSYWIVRGEQASILIERAHGS